MLPTILDCNRDCVGEKYARLNAGLGQRVDADPAEFIRDLNVEAAAYLRTLARALEAQGRVH